MNLVDYHLVIDLVPQIARLYFTNQLGEEFTLSLVQSVSNSYKFFTQRSLGLGETLSIMGYPGRFFKCPKVCIIDTC